MKVFVNRKYPLEKKSKKFDNNNYLKKQLINKKLLFSLILIFIYLYYFDFSDIDNIYKIGNK